MRILSIETSCDETAVSVVEAAGDFPSAGYKILGNALFSQIDIHREYGGVFPSVAKREHAKTLVPMLEKALEAAGELRGGGFAAAPAALDVIVDDNKKPVAGSDGWIEVEKVLEREVGLSGQLREFAGRFGRPDIDLIAVTAGPGLEPALWVGVNFAKALALLWNVPVVGVNHMEGHVLASVFDGEHLASLQFPALSLLISGGHTELIKMNDWRHYEKIGQTRDDAVGEAFDKVARLLGLPYPGGPEISRLASEARVADLPEFAKLPRPMLDSDDLDFSFSGLKTAVRYAIEGKELSEDEVRAIARDFEDAATEVLLKKTERAVNEHNIKSLILGGGVSANRHIRDTFAAFFSREYPDLALYLPDPKLSTDNSIMVALAGHARGPSALAPTPEALASLIASGNRSLADET